MTITEDPLLALIVRFVVSEEGVDSTDEEFVKRQLATLKKYVDLYPVEEKQPRAMQWIEQHAANYRREWNKRVLPFKAAEKRCEDCPLGTGASERHCAIHDQWLRLLQAYLQDEIGSGEYVRAALELLQKHKDELKIAGRGLHAKGC